VAKLLAIQVAVVYYWSCRFHTLGLVGLTTRTRLEPPITMRVSVQAMMEVFQLLDNNPLLGHYRVKMALDSLGYRYGHTTVWQMVAFYHHAQPRPPREPRSPKPRECPTEATAPHQVWFVDVRYLVQIAEQWLYSVLIFDGYSRVLLSGRVVSRGKIFRVCSRSFGTPSRGGAPPVPWSVTMRRCFAHSPRVSAS
jgi:hypothetical protein